MEGPKRMSFETAYFSTVLPRTAEVRERSPEPKSHPQSEAPGRAADDTAVTNASDEWLLGQVREGSKEALSMLFRRHARAVRNIAYRILRDTAEAEDLVQETFLFVFGKASLFDPARGSGRSWLMQVAYHRGLDRRRHLVSRRFYTHLELEEENLLTEELGTSAASYEGAIEAAFGQDALRRIESSLSEVQKRVLRLSFFDGYTMEEMGEILGQSQGNVRNHYYRALERIRKEVFGPKLKTK
jgi:RNA polymerase sigma-70 factor, ECF subfamily